MQKLVINRRSIAYLDVGSGPAVVLAHCSSASHREWTHLVAAIQEQASRLCTIAPFHANDARSEAARLITELAPGDLEMVFFTNGGADANERASPSLVPTST